jgi:hypothetical protein
MDRTRPSVASASQQLVIAFTVGPWIRIRNWIAIYPTKPPPIMNNLQLMIYKSSARKKKTLPKANLHDGTGKLA